MKNLRKIREKIERLREILRIYDIFQSNINKI